MFLKTYRSSKNADSDIIGVVVDINTCEMDTELGYITIYEDLANGRPLVAIADSDNSITIFLVFLLS